MGEMGAADEEQMAQGQSGDEEKILVSVRLRPLNEKETSRNDVSDWECINENTIINRNNLSVSERSMYPTVYTFDRVFRPDCATRQVYEDGAKEVALSVVNGINSSIFAYGQTSSGKTYTMSGITEYTVADIYDYVDKHKEREFILKFSAMEIYNESVRDLLSTDTTPLRLLDDPERGTVVERLTEETLKDWNHFKELLSVCEAERQIGETSMNEASSRSHQILRLTIESSTREFLGNDKSSALSATVNFVDLAGSERASQSLSAGMRLKEGCHINRSLLTLGTVIRKLSKGRSGHVPFRDSKLTRILQSSLGGNARTAIICTISPARSHVEQSRNTLLFASCAKEVTTNARVNVVVSDKALVKQLQRELARLESELRGTGSNSVTSDSAALLREKDLQIEKLLNEVADLNRQLEIAHSQIENLLRVAEDDRSSTLSADHHYPQLRVRSSFKSENSVSHSYSSEDPHFLDIGIRSYNTSQCLAGDNGSSSENYEQVVDFEESFIHTKFSPELSNSATNLDADNICLTNTEERTDENLDSSFNKVQCIMEAESSAISSSNLQMLETGSRRYVDSNVSSPNMNTGTSGLTEAEHEDTETQDLGTSTAKEQNDLSFSHCDFILPSPEKSSPWVLEEVMSSSRSLKMIRSRSCKARLIGIPMRFEKVDKNEGIPALGFEKDFSGELEGSQKIISAMKNGIDVEKLSENGASACVGSPAVNEYQLQSIGSSFDWKSIASVSNSDGGTKPLVDDQLEQETKSEAITYVKSVKSVGLDPIQDDVHSADTWPSEFKRLQQQIIELWQACCVSLIHRTYFFLLFNGDPSDSFYMEVELRKLTFLRDTFFKGKEAMVDGRMLSLSSSKKVLSDERQMLCREMQKRLSREERENLFLKWGIPLNSSNRRMQLVHRLWTKTSDINHIIESSALIAKLAGFEGQEQTLKQMFGLLNFTPHRRSRRRSIWKRSVMFLL